MYAIAFPHNTHTRYDTSGTVNIAAFKFVMSFQATSIFNGAISWDNFYIPLALIKVLWSCHTLLTVEHILLFLL